MKEIFICITFNEEPNVHFVQSIYIEKDYVELVRKVRNPFSEKAVNIIFSGKSNKRNNLYYYKETQKPIW